MKLFQRSVFWVALGFFTMLILWFLSWRFQTNDDVIMMWLVSGAYTGEPEPYAVFIHPSLSLGLSILYDHFPRFNWYGLFWYLFLFLAYSGLIQIIFRVIKPELRILFCTLVFVISTHFCLFPQFTLVAGWCMISALLLFFYEGVSRKDNGVKIFGFILLVIGLTVRIESCFLIFIGWIVFQIFSNGMRALSKNLPRYALIILFFGLAFGSKLIYEKNNVDKEYLAFNKARSSVIDHPVFYHLSRNGGIEKGTDWEYFSRWFMDDLDLGVDELEAKKDELDQLIFSKNSFKNSVSRLWIIGKTELFKVFISTVIILLFMVMRKNWRLSLGALLWVLFFLVMNLVFLLQGRVQVLFALVFLFPLLSSGLQFKWDLPVKWMSLGLLGLFCLHFINTRIEAKERHLMNEEFFNILSENNEPIPVFAEGYMEYHFDHVYHKDSLAPVISFGWISNSEFQSKAFRVRNVLSIRDLTSFKLLQAKSKEPPLFPDYVSFLNGKLLLKKFKNSQYFNFYEYSKAE